MSDPAISALTRPAAGDTVSASPGRLSTAFHGCQFVTAPCSLSSTSTFWATAAWTDDSVATAEAGCRSCHAVDTEENISRVCVGPPGRNADR